MKNYKAFLLIIFAFAVSIPLSLFSQKKVTYSVFLAPEFSFMKIENPSNLVLGIGSRAEPSEGVGFGYAVGSSLDYQITNSLIIRTGVQYEVSKHRYNVDFGNPFDDKNIATINSVGILLGLGKRIETKKEEVNYIPSLNVLLNIKL